MATNSNKIIMPCAYNLGNGLSPTSGFPTRDNGGACIISYPTIIIRIFFLLIFFIAGTDAFANGNFTDPEGYRYVFKESITDDESKLVAIETFLPGSSELLTRITDVPPDNCSEATHQGIEKHLTNLKEKYVAICRNDSGRRQTLYIMSHGRLISEIPFESSEPNLTWDGKSGSFVAKAYPRFLNNYGSLAPFLFIYVWNPVVPLAGKAHATFNDAVSRYYLAYYRALKIDIRKDAVNGKYFLAPLVAALVSTSSPKLICKEMHTYPLSVLTKDQLKSYADLVSSYGFPIFNIDQCSGGK